MTNLEIEYRVYKTSKSKARITLKDHKEDFRNCPKSRLINPCKPNIGKVAKQKLSKVIDKVKAVTNMTQWKNSFDVIEWFTDIKDKKKCSFIVLDVVEYYPSITRKLLGDALRWASTITEISNDDIELILSAKR